MGNRAGLKKVVKSVRGKRGSVRRTYWVKSSPKKAANPRQSEQKPGFLRRHAGKIIGAAALAGLAYANRNKLAGAARGAGLALNAHKHSGRTAGAMERAKDAFRAAKLGYSSNRGMDRVDSHIARAGKAIGKARAGATTWRRSVGADLGDHLTRIGGAAAAEHVGSRFGQVAGTAIGGMFGGAPGAAVGGFIGGHAGGFVAGRHAAPHIARGATWLSNRLRR